jgi:hypothetical protein
MGTFLRYFPVVLLFAGFITSAGCRSGIPKNALALQAQSLERRQISSRRFETTDENQLLAASAGLLQDLGFTIDDSETDLGMIVASKERSAVEGGQVAGKIVVGVLFGIRVAIDKNQKLRASIVTRPVGKEIVVRATFQRIVWNEDGQISRLELLDHPRMYQEFFEKLSKAVFLEAQSL